MRAVDIVQRKRDGEELGRDEIAFFIQGYTRGEIPDYQASAFAMAVFFKGMTPAETVALTESMMRTGEVLDLSDLPGPRVDKHSTGGVGDKTSLILAPLAAAAGAYVPMISGRGLGHTGGTLDKLESIPGFRVGLSLKEFRQTLRKCGLGLIGQTPEIAPADRKLYALRDVTATVESLPLIAASIMSKKMAEGIDALVLDVKTGDGAFMKAFEDSKALAEAMVRIGRGMGKKVSALITDMEQPLGRTVGNALEVKESVETLQGHGPKDLESLSLELAAWMLHLAGITPGLDTARTRVRDALASGAGLRKFQEVIGLQGGDPRVGDDTSRLPQARETIELRSEAEGRVAGIACRAVGQAAMLLGAGRETVDSRIDPAVGVVLHKKVGDPVREGETLMTLHVNERGRLEEATRLLRQAVRVAREAPPATPLVRLVLDR
ncbi:MAG TPA: thymidine phosphorylase [Vicinamibacteria bacterium]